jgi:hypothetical protein
LSAGRSKSECESPLANPDERGQRSEYSTLERRGKMTDVARCLMKAGVVAVVLGAVTACSEGATQPESIVATPGAAPHMVACDQSENVELSCDPGGGDVGGGGSGPAAAPTYLTHLMVANCDPAFDYRCAPFCNIYDFNCIQMVMDGHYFQIRQNLFEADGTPVEYNEQRLHSDPLGTGTGDLNNQVFSHNMCGHPGRWMNVEIYELHTFNILFRKASFVVHSNENGVMKTVGSGIDWVAWVRYSWPC